METLKLLYFYYYCSKRAFLTKEFITKLALAYSLSIVVIPLRNGRQCQQQMDTDSIITILNRAKLCNSY